MGLTPLSITSYLSCLWYALAAALLALFLLSRAWAPLSTALLKHGKTVAASSASSSTSTSTSTATASRLCTRLHVSKRWFAAFYGVGLAFNGLALAVSYTVFVRMAERPTAASGGGGGDGGSGGVVCAALLFQLHLLRRLIECMYLSRASTATMHVLHLLFGLAFYVLVPATLFAQCLLATSASLESTKANIAAAAALDRPDLVILMAGVLDSVVVSTNTTGPGRADEAVWCGAVDQAGACTVWYVGAHGTNVPWAAVGAFLMVAGGYCQYCCHRTLALLRGGSGGRPGGSLQQSSAHGRGEATEVTAAGTGTGTAGIAGTTDGGAGARRRGKRTLQGGEAGVGAETTIGKTPPGNSTRNDNGNGDAEGDDDVFRASETAVYRIPRGGLFEYVSSPHYLCEIVIYVGLGLAAGSNGAAGVLQEGAAVARGATCSIEQSIVALWGGVVATTSANLLASAIETHAWYRRVFKGRYPEKRKALVPWVV